ncbi:MAG: cobalamin B12-binding domain-containing protein [Candidatus Helarchaeota archaeon]
MEVNRLYEEFFNLTRSRKYKEALDAIRKGLNKVPPREILINVIGKTLDNLQSFEEEGYKQISAFQILAATKIAEDALKLLKPELEKSALQNGTDRISKNKVIIGNIFQDHHALGKEIVKVFLQAHGFEVIDLGVGVTASEFVKIARKEGAKWIYVSAMMYNTALGIKKIVDELEAKNLTDIKVVVGGAPFRFYPDLYKKINADFTSDSAVGALNILIKGDVSQ